MSKRLIASALGFVLALCALAFSSKRVQAAPTVCHVLTCIVGGQPHSCCLDTASPIACLPCGGIV